VFSKRVLSQRGTTRRSRRSFASSLYARSGSRPRKGTLLGSAPSFRLSGGKEEDERWRTRRYSSTSNIL
jgi:hypothetical protein